MANNGAQLGLHLLNSISQKAKEFNKIKQTRINNQMDQEKWNLEKKKYQADIEYKKSQGEINSAQAMVLQDTLKQRDKMRKSQYQFTQTATDQALDKSRAEAKQIGEVLKHLGTTFTTSAKGGVTMTETYGYKDPAQIKPASVSKEEKVLGELQTGEIYNEDEMEYMPFESRKDMEKYTSRNLGNKWKEKFPEAQKIIDETFPPPEPIDTTKGVKAGLDIGTAGVVKKVRVISPNGVLGYIPESKLEEAKKKGFKVES